MWELDYKESWAPDNWCFWAMVLEKTPEIPLDYKEIQQVHPKGKESLVTQSCLTLCDPMDIAYQAPPSTWFSRQEYSSGLPFPSPDRKSVLNIHWKDWCWSWNSNALATWCKELTHLKRPWCWERLRAGGEGDDRGWDGWMASLTRWTWVWVDSRSWWWTGKPGILRFMGSQRIRHDWATELNWTALKMQRRNCSRNYKILNKIITYQNLCNTAKAILEGNLWLSKQILEQKKG